MSSFLVPTERDVLDLASVMVVGLPCSEYWETNPIRRVLFVSCFLFRFSLCAGPRLMCLRWICFGDVAIYRQPRITVILAFIVQDPHSSPGCT